jgi:cyanophycinase
MAPVFLIGGGRDGDAVRAGGRQATQETFVAAGGTDRLRRDLLYAGFSAGAAIAAGRAIVGGFRRDDGRLVCAEEAGEDLEALAVRPGLGLVPFAVDVHATHWGTLTRLAHAVDAGLVDEGWAVDEGTAVVARDGVARVTGLGSAYRVARDSERLSVTVVPAVATGRAGD